MLSAKVKLLVAGLLLWFASSAMAVTCTSTTSFGSVGPPGIETFGNILTAVGSYSDCYTFSLSGDTVSFGGLSEQNTLFNRWEIDVTNVALFDGDVLSGSTTGTLLGEDFTPDSFTFSGLSLGTYALVVFSEVVRIEHGVFFAPVAYLGQITTVATPPAPGPTQVPEPGTLGLLGMGLAALGIVRRRRAA